MDRVINRKDRRSRLALARKAPDQWLFESRPDAARLIALHQREWGACVACHVSPLYSVQVYESDTALGQVVHLCCRRHDGQTDIPWTHKQRIKDLLVGADRVAVEVFPARDHLVDSANLYHLWVLPAGFELPFTLEADRG